MTTKRVCELVIGDCFKYYNVFFIVYKKDNDRIYYMNRTEKYPYGTGTIESFGAKNKMKVEIIPSGSEESNMMLLHQPENKHEFFECT